MRVLSPEVRLIRFNLRFNLISTELRGCPTPNLSNDFRLQINGWTALHWAVKRNNMRIVDALLKSGADANLYTSKGEQAYQLSTNEHIAKVLMTKDAMAKARKQRQQHSGSAGNRSRDSVSQDKKSYLFIRDYC